jgi:hypothetical protein
MDESCSDQDTGTEMLAEEEKLWWDLHPSDFFGHDRKTATTNRREEDDDYWRLTDCKRY